MPGAGPSGYCAFGFGSNIIWIEPDADLVAVMRWMEPTPSAGSVPGSWRRGAAAMDSRPLDVLCMGEAMVEFVRVSGGGNTWRGGFGGDTSNCAIAAARQGARAGYLTALGTDRFGDTLLELWRSEGVDVSGVRRDAHAPTGVYFIEPAPEGRDFTYYRAGSAASRLSPEHLSEDLIGGALVFQTSAITQAISESACETVFRAIATARARGTRVAYDTNLRLNLWSLERARATIGETLRHADILLPSLDEARVLTGLDRPEAILDRYLEHDPELLALTCGADGAWVAAGGRIEHVSGPAARDRGHQRRRRHLRGQPARPACGRRRAVRRRAPRSDGGSPLDHRIRRRRTDPRPRPHARGTPLTGCGQDAFSSRRSAVRVADRSSIRSLWSRTAGNRSTATPSRSSQRVTVNRYGSATV